MKFKDLNKICFIFINIISLIVGIYLLLSDIKKEYEYMALLPIVFSIVSCINMKLYKYLFSKISITIIILSYFFRMVILPIIIYLFDYATIIENQTHLKYITQAFLLMSYEFLVVMTILNIYTEKIFNKNNKNSKISSFKSYNMKNFTVIVIVLLIMVIIALFIFPDLKYYVTFVFVGEFESVNQQSINFNQMRENVTGVSYWISTFFINMLQFLLPIYLIKLIYDRKFLKESMKIFLSLTVIIFSICIATPDRARSIMIAIMLAIILLYMYPKKAKFIVKLVMIGGGISAILGLLIKSGIMYKEVNFSSLFQAYFSGVNNVANGFLISIDNNISIFINDILNSIPYILAFFTDLPTTTELYNYIIYNTTDKVTQIIPMVCQGMCYFGIVLSPILSVISTIVAVKVEEKMLKEKGILTKYIYLFFVIMASAAPVVYNFTILIKNILGAFVPIIVVSKLFIDKKEKKCAHYHQLKI